MKISAGLLKGRKIGSGRISPKKDTKAGFRPTSSKVREAVFDILRNDIRNSDFLDLYAGSGTVGFEALSRGAATCSFVEQEPTRFREIVLSVKRMGLDARAKVFHQEAAGFLRRAVRSGMFFGIIFADPPYASQEVREIFPVIDESDVLRQGGVLIVEHPSKKEPGHAGRSLRFVKNYKYGDTMLTLFRKDL